MTAFSQANKKISDKITSLRKSPGIVSAFWVFLNTGGSQLIRLGGNLILTRLLVPEYFGIMTLVQTVVFALGQLSDIGLREGIIKSSRSNDPVFMQTAWTLQVIRGFFIAFGIVLLAWPVSKIYGEPLLFPILLVLSTTSIVSNFRSIAPIIYEKHMNLKIEMVSGLVMAVIGIAFMSVLAYFWQSVWALVAGTIFQSILTVSTSYLLYKGHHSKFRWDKETVNELIRFGKWIFISSIVSFLAAQSDKLVMGTWMSMHDLGLYSIAAVLASLTALIAGPVAHKVLFPYFRKCLEQPDALRKIHKARRWVNLGFAAFVIFLALVGNQLVLFLYDDRYIAAGWMVQLLAIGRLAKIYSTTLYNYILAMGDSYSMMKFNVINIIILITLMALGGWLGGEIGVLVGYSIAGIFTHPTVVYFARQHGYKCFWADMRLIFISCAITFLGWWLFDAPVLTELASLLPSTWQ